MFTYSGKSLFVPMNSKSCFSWSLISWDMLSCPYRSDTSSTFSSTLIHCSKPFCTKYLLGQPKQQVDVTHADDGDIQSEFIDRQLSKGSHLMMGISKEKSLRTHHQGGHQNIHASGATLDNR